MKIYNSDALEEKFDWQDIVVLVGCAFAIGFVLGLVFAGVLR